MKAETPELAILLECLQDRLPALHRALLLHGGASLEKIDLKKGDVLLRQREAANALYVISTGLLGGAVAREDGSELKLPEFGPGQMAGEMAMLAGGGVYSATVHAVEDTVLVKVPRTTFERIAERAPQAIQEMSEGIRRRILRDQLAIGLTRLLGPMHDTVLQYVESRVEWVRLHAGETLFTEGDQTRDLYFVLGGRLQAVARDGRVLSEMSRGESIGEIALLTGEPRTATVVAVRDSDLVRVAPETFDEIVSRYPQVMQVVARIVVQRLRAKERTGSGGGSKKCIAVLAAGAGLASTDFTERLVKALERIGSTLHLSSKRVDRLLNQPGIARADKEHAAGIRLTAWLDEQEARTQFLVYETDATDSPWTQRGLRQADEILLVAQAGADPVPSGLETTLLGPGRISKARQTLVLLHADGSRLPSGTSRWFSGRNIQNHFHIRLDGEGDFERIARCLAGVAIGLVFGGGGARGLAHIGVIRALREAGIPIDMVGGTSMGAVIAAAVGMGFDWKQTLELSREGWLRYKPHKEYTLPFISLVRSRVLERWAKEIYGDTQIEDLWVNFFCVACNLTSSEMAVFERGPLWQAVRASAALPGIFVPVLLNGNVFVDGAIVNNLPGDIMRKRSCGTLMVVDVGAEHAFAFELTEFPSPWKLLWSHLLPFAKPIVVPNIGAVLMRTTEVSSNQKAIEVKRNADLCLRPPIDGYGVLEFVKIDELVEIGYQYTKQTLESLREHNSLPALFAKGSEIGQDHPVIEAGVAPVSNLDVVG